MVLHPQQWQEEMDYNPRSEGENCLELSNSDRRRADSAAWVKIKAEADKGKVVVYYKAPSYCRFTDACIGHVSVFETSFDTHEQAKDWINALGEDVDPDICYCIYPAPPESEQAHVIVPDDEGYGSMSFSF